MYVFEFVIKLINLSVGLICLWQDILDSFFNQLRGLQDDEFDPQLVTGVITTYLDEAIIKIAELAIQL